MADSQDVRDRAFRYASNVADLGLSIARRAGANVVANQLIRAGTSVGANLEEAKAASTKREFIRCTEISLREARESVYWLRVCGTLSLGPASVIEELVGEGEQLKRILSTIIVRAKQLKDGSR